MQLLLSTLCLALTSAVIGNAYLQKKQFYPTVVHITKSNACMAVIYIQFFVIVFMFGKLLRKIFLGTLRPAEFEHLLERFWYALTETCLAFTVFRDDFNPRFVALFTVLLFLKSFHWLAEERVDFMERSPVLGILFHIRVTGLIVLLGVADYVFLMHAYESTMARGPTVQLVFGFEYAILLTVVANIAIKYVIHSGEMRTDTPWEDKAVFLLYTELVIGFIKVILYIFFVVIMAKIYALPMFVFRPMFYTIKNFKKALSDVILSRRAIRNMNTLYPDATPEELQLSDNLCIICREDMVNHSKKLPCGHIFHATCLRSWFQRQQTCPTCRLNILRAPTNNSRAMPRAEPAAPAAGAPAAPAAPRAGVAPQIVPPAGGAGTLPPTLTQPATLLPNSGAATPPHLGAAMPNFATMPGYQMPLMMPPPFPFIAPYSVPPPPMPPDLTNLSEAELRSLEGSQRRNVEERLKLLNQIQLMLDAAGVLMNHYQIAHAKTSESIAMAAPLDVNVGAEAAPLFDDEQPSTSGAAGVAFLGALPTAAPVNAAPSTAAANGLPPPLIEAEAVVEPTAATSLKAPPEVLRQNDVILEDLGDEEEYTATASSAVDANSMLIAPVAPTKSSPPSASSAGTTEAADAAESDELSELRKRRLKFLTEHQKSSSSTSASAE